MSSFNTNYSKMQSGGTERISEGPELWESELDRTIYQGERGVRYFSFAKTHGILIFCNITEHAQEIVKKLNTYYESFTAEETEGD